ncbi:hypothetical protein FRC02_009812 [Tulasnella sp. 418]|nr:hypothetical protein FRC02_009812 [Tulasnella sp. 418]
MSSSDTLRIPAFVGGIPTKADFAPSILFCVLYGLLIIPILYRFFNQKSRVYLFLLFGTIPFAIERIVVYGIRASQSHTPTSANWLDQGGSRGKLVYQQISFSLGFFGFATDAVPMLRCLLVNTTLEDEERGSTDKPRPRFWYRRFAEVFGLVYLAASIPGIIAGGRYSKAIRDQSAADRAFQLR